METKHSLLNQISLNLTNKKTQHPEFHFTKKSTGTVSKSSPCPPPSTPTNTPLGKASALPREALKSTPWHRPRPPPGQGHACALVTPAAGVTGCRPSLLTDLRVGQDFQSFMTLYLSLQVSGGTQPDPQPLSQLLICLYGFILCVKPAHNSITVRVTELSPECHKWFSLLTAASRARAVRLPRRTHILSPARVWRRHLLLRGERAKDGFGGDVWSLNIRGKKEAGPALPPARKAPRLLSPAQRWDIRVMSIHHCEGPRVENPPPLQPLRPVTWPPSPAHIQHAEREPQGCSPPSL